MDKWRSKIYRLSLSQLKALEVLAASKKGIIEADESIKVVGLKGKNLGGVFSALSRQKIGKESLILPWGRSEAGRGLRWKLNTKVVEVKELRSIIKEVLSL
ncbi:MAG: hypothetical protein KIH89_002950 [Candidatus Shapirobacteria bacterium]|nr:hypothetical protein [Candidatus Shapirobacteria bacterium]